MSLAPVRQERAETPHNIDFEKCLLGGILVESRRLKSAAAIVAPRDFFRDAHRKLFAQMLTADERGEPFDPVSLAHELNSDEVTVAYIASLTDMPRGANLEFYAEKIKQLAAARGSLALADDLRRRLVANDIDGSAATLRRLTETVNQQARRQAPVNWHTGQTVAERAAVPVPWLASPYLAVGAITELTGKAKSAGKTSLALHLAACRISGIDFLGHPTKPGPVVYLTEESETTFDQAMKRAGLFGVKDFHFLSFWDLRGLAWQQIVDIAMERALSVGAEHIVVDTLSKFAGFKGEAENNSGDADLAMEPLQAAAAAGVGIQVLRHERKGGGDVGEAGRGSSAFTGAADIILSLRRPDGRMRDTVRVLQALSRFSETPETLMIEQIHSRLLTSEFGENAIRSYVALGSEAAVITHEAETVILDEVPTGETHAISRDDLQARHPDIKGRTLDRALKALTDSRRISRIGSGKKGSAYRYFRSIEALS